MKKIWLLTTLLVAGLLLTGCNKSVNVENEQERIFACWSSVSEYLGISDYSISWDKEEEAWAYFVLNWRVNIWNGIDEEKITKNVSCVIDMVDKSVTILEIDEPVVEIPDDFDGCNNYFDGCNRCTLQDNWEIVCTELACEEYQEAYCADEQYDEFLEDIRSNIPLCNDIDLNRNTKYTYIDNVVENCTYEEWTAYSWNWGWCWWVMPHLYITKDIIWYFDIVADEDHPIICKSPRAWIIKSLSGDFEDLATFWYKHWITKKALIDTLEARTDEEVFRNGCWYYFCNGDICEQFYRPSYWENENHYYIYWYRYPINGPYETVLLVDDKLYMLWQSENMFNEDHRPNPVKQWRWVVYWLDWDKLIVKRYVDWELIPPYTLENFNSYNFDEPTTTTKFKVKTCEIPL